jgi:hypothetical protein
MSGSKNSGASSGLGILGMLGIVFVTLKLLGVSGVAQWSWWWVTAPFWGAGALLLAILLIALVWILLREIGKSVFKKLVKTAK